jgi:hypothetical protein
MARRYTITFNPKLSNIEEPLKRVENLGVVVQSAQHFIGTAVVEANDEQVEKVKRLNSVAGVTETGSVSAS